MGQKQQLLWDLPPAETFALNRAIYDVPRAQAEETLARADRAAGDRRLISKPTRQLSLGERMKCELVAALLHRPRVLFLDEPTIGLDVSMQAKMRDFIRDYNERYGATVMLTSHYMDDVAALCPRVIVIDKGRLIYDGGLRRAGAPRAAGEARGPPAVAAGGRGPTWPAGDGRSRATRRRRCCPVPQDAGERRGARALATLPVTDLTVENAPLEEVMSELFHARGREQRPPPAPGDGRRARERRRCGRAPRPGAAAELARRQGVPDAATHRLRRGGGLPRRDAGLGAGHHHAAGHAGAVDAVAARRRRWGASVRRSSSPTSWAFGGAAS